jgi:hypothetical protein
MSGAVNNSPKQRGRPFPKGVSGNARGRPPGSRNKRTRALLEAAEAGGELPLDYMLRVMRDSKVPDPRRDEMAKASAPYLHPKQLAVDQRLKSDGYSEAFKEFLRSIDGESRRLPRGNDPDADREYDAAQAQRAQACQR